MTTNGAVGAETTIDAEATSASTPTDDTARNSIISVSVVSGIIVLVVVLSYLIWRIFFKSIRPKHGTENLESKDDMEKQEEQSKKARRKNYYDQFNVDDNQLTVNSVTAIKFDGEEYLATQKQPSQIKTECETEEPAQTKPPTQIHSGKRVFSINKVPERPRTHDSMVIKLPKKVARSLQAGDCEQYTFAVIDQNSKTIHNIDMREYRMVRGNSPGKYGNVHRVHLATNHQRHSRASPKRTAFSDGEYLHDSPDGNHKKHPLSHSADETEIATDSSGTHPSSRTSTPSLSSQDELLMISKPPTSSELIKLSNIENHSTESGNFSNGSDVSDRLIS